MTDRESELKELVAETLDVRPEAITPELSRDEAPEWDSLSHLRLVFALEERFGLKLTMQHVADLRTFGEIRDLLCAEPAA